jgi:hypothetical protein
MEVSEMVTHASGREALVFERDDDLRRLASARRDRVRFVMVPRASFVAIDGTAEPGSDEFIAAIRTLYGIAYRLHFTLKARGLAGRVGMLEALYWMTPEELTSDAPTDASRRVTWRWRLLIAVPEAATEDDVDATCRAAADDPMVHRVFLDRWAEGTSAQILHVGSYANETATLGRLHEAIRVAGLRPRGAHHEIYLNDPRRVGEDRARTILRQPVAQV